MEAFQVCKVKFIHLKYVYKNKFKYKLKYFLSLKKRYRLHK